ncbi:diguanylate cyclase [Clostridium aminobutyricum]|uniref:Stage 0 sporulation protein A homolog n=1 Tax=Clostridium aminobutyricum TaxID=33953 RepID=A0A939DAC1_CLOAM|nr:diguanylate cyclase [Clostridium aminobutyricum]MBN7774319.1 diguanylate cyclase [Clostridium aminobutyricum]
MQTEMPSVLIVDDSPLNLMFIESILKRNHYKIKTASTGAEAIEVLTNQNPDIILLDIILPDLSGFDLCKSIRSNPDTDSIPIIFISSRSEPDEIQKGLRIGGSDYLIKPFNEIELLARIDNHYKYKKSQDKLKALNEELLKANNMIAKKNEALENALLQLAELATTDSLTNLYNRRYIMERINEEVIRYRQTGRVFSLVICDIDYFKQINDQYGHDFGDYCLKEISKVILINVREADIVSRWGGEEFLIFLSETDKRSAYKLAERIRFAISKMSIRYNDIDISMTVTIGLSEYNGNSKVEESIKRADIALYRGKSDGRNRVVVAS